MTIEQFRAPRHSARVVAQFRDRFVVRDENGDHDAILAGRFRHEVASAEDLPAVGDYVGLSSSDDMSGVAMITRIEPRRTAFKRKTAGAATEPQVIAANVDLAIVATSPHDFSPRRIERYLTLAWESGATPIVALTKADLLDDATGLLAELQSTAIGVDVLIVSALDGTGMIEIAERIAPGTTAVLLGSSGVGKSTLVNALLGNDRQRTAAIRDDGTGRHTTTHRELIELPNGGCLIDTPGLRELQLWTANDGLDATFDDIATLAAGCRFRDCTHRGEPDCAVLDAVASGRLSPDRLESWHTLGRELAFLERKQDAAAAAASKSRAKSLSRLLRSRLREKGE